MEKWRTLLANSIKLKETAQNSATFVASIASRARLTANFTHQ